MFSNLLPLLFLLIKISSSQRLNVGDECILGETRQRSTCKLLTNCEEAVKQLQYNRKPPQICGFANTDSIVCCPPADIIQPEPQVASKRQPGFISKIKCREYAKYVFDKVRPPILLIDTPEVERNECGHKVVKLIVGGLPAEKKEFPHMASLGYETASGDILWGCGGTIISKEYILTAAHCLNSQNFGPVKYVKIGVTNLKKSSIHLQQIKVSERIAHPEYNQSSFYHDIALLRLEKPAKLNPSARPACLYVKREITAEKAIATGWGNTQYAGISSDDLLKVTLNLFDYETCSNTYKNAQNRLKHGIFDDSQFCAGGLNGEEKDTCQGDSGGPLQIFHINDDVECMYDIIGVTSFGKPCVGSPGVYTRVSNYISWIEDIVWPE